MAADDRVLNALAPELAKLGLRLPSYFSYAGREGAIPLQIVILHHFGLTTTQLKFMVSWWSHDDLRVFNRLKLIPRNKRLAAPGALPENVFLRDHPENATFVYETALPLGTPVEVAKKDFVRLFKAEKRRFGLNLLRPDKNVLHMPTFLRDLVVLALSEQRQRWTAEEINRQLSHMRLPSISASIPNAFGALRRYRKEKEPGKRDPKTDRRDIVRKMKRRLKLVKESPLFASET